MPPLLRTTEVYSSDNKSNAKQVELPPGRLRKGDSISNNSTPLS